HSHEQFSRSMAPRIVQEKITTGREKSESGRGSPNPSETTSNFGSSNTFDGPGPRLAQEIRSGANPQRKEIRSGRILVHHEIRSGPNSHARRGDVFVSVEHRLRPHTRHGTLRAGTTPKSMVSTSPVMGTVIGAGFGVVCTANCGRTCCTARAAHANTASAS